MTTFYESCAAWDFKAKKREITAEKEVAYLSKRSRPIIPYKFSVKEQWPAWWRIQRRFTITNP
jgi:hypothetical protein